MSDSERIALLICTAAAVVVLAPVVLFIFVAAMSLFITVPMAIYDKYIRGAC